MKSNRVKKKSFTGFTLVEVITTLVILALIAAIAIPSLVGYIDSAREKAAVEECRIVVEAASDLAVDNVLENGYVSYTEGDENFINNQVTKAAIMELSEAGGEIKEYSFDPAKSNSYTEPTYLVNNDEVVVSGAKGIELAKDVSALAVSVDDSDYETYAVKGVSLTYMRYTASNGVEVIYYNDGYDASGVVDLSNTTHVHIMQPVKIHKELTCTNDEITLFKCTEEGCTYNYLSVTAEAPGHNVEAIDEKQHKCVRSTVTRHKVEGGKLVEYEDTTYSCNSYDEDNCGTAGAHNHDFGIGSMLVSQQAHTYEMLTAEDYTGKAIINGVFCEKSNFDGTVKYTNIQYCTVCGILQCDKYEESEDDTNSGSGKLIRMVDQSNKEITAGGKYYLVSAGGAEVGPLTIDEGYLKDKNDEFIKVAYDASGNGVTNSNKVYASSTGTTYTLVEKTAVEGYQAIASGTKITIKVKNINGGMLEDISATGSNSEIIDEESMEVIIELNPLLYFTVKLQGNNGTKITSLKNGVYDLTDSSGNTTVATITVNENSRYTVTGTDVNGGSATEEFSFAEGVRFYINAKNSTKSTSDGVSTGKLCLSVGEYHLYERTCPDGWQTIGDDKYILIDLSSFSFKATLTSQLKNVSLTVAQAGFLNYNSATEYDTENGQHLTKKDAVYDENGEYSDPTLQIEYKKTAEEKSTGDGNWIKDGSDTYNGEFSDKKTDENGSETAVTITGNGRHNTNAVDGTYTAPYGSIITITNNDTRIIKSITLKIRYEYTGYYPDGVNNVDNYSSGNAKLTVSTGSTGQGLGKGTDYTAEGDGKAVKTVTIQTTEKFKTTVENYNQRTYGIEPNESTSFFIDFGSHLTKDACFYIDEFKVEYVDSYVVPIQVNYYGDETVTAIQFNNAALTDGGNTWKTDLNSSNPIYTLNVYEQNNDNPITIQLYKKGQWNNNVLIDGATATVTRAEIKEKVANNDTENPIVVNIGKPTEPNMLNDSDGKRYIVVYDGADVDDVAFLRVTVGEETYTEAVTATIPKNCEDTKKNHNKKNHYILFSDSAEGYSFRANEDRSSIKVELLDSFSKVIATEKCNGRTNTSTEHIECSASFVKVQFTSVPQYIKNNSNDYTAVINKKDYSIEEALSGVRVENAKGIEPLTACIKSADGTVVCSEVTLDKKVDSGDLGRTYTYEFTDESVVVKVNLTDSNTVKYDTAKMEVKIGDKTYTMTDALSGIRLYSPTKATIKIIGVDDSELSSIKDVKLSNYYGKTYTYNYSSSTSNTITIKLDSTQYPDLYKYINSVYIHREASDGILGIGSRTELNMTIEKTFESAPSDSVVVTVGGFASSNSNGTTVQVKDKDGNVIAQADPKTGFGIFSGVFGSDITVTPTCYLFNVSTAFTDTSKLGSLTSATLTVTEVKNKTAISETVTNIQNNPSDTVKVLALPADDATELEFTLTDSSGQTISIKTVTLDANYLGKVQNVTFDTVEEDYTAPIVTASDKISLKITFDCDLASEVTQVEVDGTNYPVTDTQNIVVQNFKPSNASQYYCAPITIKLKNTDDTVLGEATLSDYWNEMSTTVNVDITPTAIKIYAELPEGMEETGLQFRLNNGSYTSLSKMKNGLTYAPSGDLRVDLYRNDTWITYVTVPQTTLKSYLGSSYTVNFKNNFLNLKFTVPSVYEESTLSIQVGNDTKSYSNVSGGWLYAPGSGTTSFNVYLKQNDTTIATATVANFTSSMGGDYTVDFASMFKKIDIKMPSTYNTASDYYLIVNDDGNNAKKLTDVASSGFSVLYQSGTLKIVLKEHQYWGRELKTFTYTETQLKDQDSITLDLTTVEIK